MVFNGVLITRVSPVTLIELVTPYAEIDFNEGIDYLKVGPAVSI